MRPGFVFCICPDGRLLKNEIAAMLAANSAGQDWQKNIFWGDEALSDQFWEHMTLQGLIDAPRAVIVRNAHNIPADVWKRLSQTLARPPGNTWPFFCLEGQWEKGAAKIPAHISKQRCFEHAAANNWIWRHGGLESKNISSYIAMRAKKLNMRFAPGALEAWASILNPDAASIDNELEKLSLYATDGVISKEMTVLVDNTPAFDIFLLLRRLQGGQTKAVWQSIQAQTQHNEDLIFPFIGLLLREARLLWQLKAGENPYLFPSDASVKRELSMRLGFASMAAIWDAAHTAELSVKSGQNTPLQALDRLIAELTLLFDATARRAA
jgi:DNA polymerase-3 subunit delta